jgi:3-dehydroquinate dehydratase/shikimate dehydrogenase
MSYLAASLAVDIDDLQYVIARAQQAASNGARLVEWRIDELANHDDASNALDALLRQSPLPCIITIRPAWEGGAFVGDESTRAQLFVDALTADNPPRYIDVELRAWQRDPDLRTAIVQHLGEPDRSDTATSLILSSHDHHDRPHDLMQRVADMNAEDHCKVVKIAWMARSLRDNLEAFDLLTERAKPTIALCMGQYGLLSRVLAPKFGGFLTFAAVDDGDETAPGQPTLDDLVNRYHINRINRETELYGVIGWPVAHSLSPHIHNAGFRAVNHNGVYLPLPIPPAYEHFKATVGSMIDHPRLDFRGASVTIPHKENLVKFIEQRDGRITDLARACGAANTLIHHSADQLACSNTDAPAACDTLIAAMRMNHKQFAGSRIAVIGAGGVARAVVAGLSRLGATVVLFNRTRARAIALADQFNGRPTIDNKPARVLVGDADTFSSGNFHAFVNCTPLGMAGTKEADRSPLDMFEGVGVPINERVTVFDTVYTPARTPMLADAEARGAKIVPGIDMFMRQAAMQFEQWTGQVIPHDLMFDAIRNA